jgi:hypothetical protein
MTRIEDEEIKKYERYRAHLCEKYERKCHGNRCPLAKFGCYNYQSFSAIRVYAHKSFLKRVVFAMIDEARREGYEL